MERGVVKGTKEKGGKVGTSNGRVGASRTKETKKKLKNWDTEMRGQETTTTGTGPKNPMKAEGKREVEKTLA